MSEERRKKLITARGWRFGDYEGIKASDVLNDFFYCFIAFQTSWASSWGILLKTNATVDWYLSTGPSPPNVEVKFLFTVEIFLLARFTNNSVQSLKRKRLCLPSQETDETCWIFSAVRWITSANLHTSTSRCRAQKSEHFISTHQVFCLYEWSLI